MGHISKTIAITCHCIPWFLKYPAIQQFKIRYFFRNRPRKKHINVRRHTLECRCKKKAELCHIPIQGNVERFTL